jgi:protein associated with RNAse G/E
MEQVMKAFKESVDVDVKTKNIEKILDESEFDTDLRFFVLVNGIMDKNIYKNIRTLAPFIKNVKIFFIFVKKIVC